MTEILTRQSDDDRAVSPVIGVILMVAITVILAAVIGFFVLDLGGSQDTAPQASFSVENDGSAVTVTVESTGSTISSDTLSCAPNSCTINSDLTAGSTFTYSGSGGDELRVIWDSPSSDQSSTIANLEVPA